MPAHTPGPWHVGNAHGAARDHAVCAGHRVIARVTGGGYPTSVGWAAETAANARLIAAAPDLLAALDEILVELDNREPPQGSIYRDTGGMMLARAAIAKATGGTAR